MRKKYSYYDCYSILDMQPGCNWAELRSAYKKSIQKWHPDRFEDGSNEKLAAENKIKTLNIAYDHINKYYREKGKLPLVGEYKDNKNIDPATSSKVRKYSTQKQSPEENNETTKNASNDNFRKNHVSTPKKKSRHVITILVLTICFTAYYFFSHKMDANIHSKQEINSASNSISKVQLHTSPTKTSNTTKYLADHLAQKTFAESATQSILADENKLFASNSYFTRGSSISDVIGIQGAPSETDGDIWYYGKSEVHFNEGRVTHWVRHQDSPLNVRMNMYSQE